MPEAAREVCTRTVSLYASSGFVVPWVGYLAVREGEVVGTCAFKRAPDNGVVEMVYFTFPEFEGQGVGTAMAQRLVELAQSRVTCLMIIANTAPRNNAANAILRKLGFNFAGTNPHHADGEVWEWHLGEHDPAGNCCN
jgi:RimJ/RimL family protein N-acetyltransferase